MNPAVVFDQRRRSGSRAARSLVICSLSLKSGAASSMYAMSFRSRPSVRSALGSTGLFLLHGFSFKGGIAGFTQVFFFERDLLGQSRALLQSCVRRDHRSHPSHQPRSCGVLPRSSRDICGHSPRISAWPWPWPDRNGRWQLTSAQSGSPACGSRSSGVLVRTANRGRIRICGAKGEEEACQVQKRHAPRKRAPRLSAVKRSAS